MQTCENCRYSTVMTNDKKEKVNDGALICRRSPPRNMMIPVAPDVRNPMGGGFGINSFYPMVGRDNWCGEWAALDKSPKFDIVK